MFHYQENEMEEWVDDEIDDFDDDLDNDVYVRRGGLESDDDDNENADPSITDTSHVQAKRGKDIQGIPWDRLNITRNKYRQTRLEQYKNYENVPTSGDNAKKECMETKKEGFYYEFHRNTRSVKSTILHFQ
ncbi:putative WD-repeat protein, partial [Zostera marina]